MNFLLSKINNAFFYYTDFSLFTFNNHIYLDNPLLITNFNDICNEIQLLYNKNDITDYNIIVKEDMNIKVFILSYCIIRICHIDIFNHKYQYIYDFIFSVKHDNLEHIYNIYYTNKYVIIVSKKIIPLIINNCINPSHLPNINNIIINISLIIYYLLDNGISHNDVSIDNIGYDVDIDKYVLYDYDKCSIILFVDNIYSLYKSIDFYFVR